MIGGCWCKLMNRFLCTSIAQDILNLIIHSTMSDVSFIKCMILCYIFLEALYVCVVYIMVGVANEWDLNLQKHWWICQRKSLISALVQEGEGDCGSERKAQAATTFFLRSVLSRCGIGVKKPCPLRKEYQKQTHWQSWCLDHAPCPHQCRAVPGQAHWNSWSFWTKIFHIFLKSKSGLWIAAQ